MENRKMCSFVVAGLVLVSFAVGAQAGKSSVEFGRQLFTDPALGGSTNDKSCESCHPGGKGLEAAGAAKNLSKRINQCIEGPLQGAGLDGRSAEMRSLKLYIESLGQAK